jgi:hypothetical protein
MSINFHLKGDLDLEQIIKYASIVAALLTYFS